MKKLLLSFLVLISLSANTQELDQAYLNSLPEDVREDVLKSMDEREELETPVYRRPSTMISKNYCTGTEDDEINEDCIEKSDRFGSNFFDMMQTSFMPINEPNMDSSYLLDFGDILELQLIGQKNSIEKLNIKRDGSINIPEIGKLFIAGLSLEEVSSIIKNKVSNAFIGVQAFISLVNIRDIQILITGNAFSPGIYTLNGNSTLLHALSMAGGIDEKGSYRRIDLIREDKIIGSFDLYDIFIHGKSNYLQRLRTGDSIVIRPAGTIASISGAVNRPGSYELTQNETLYDLFEFGNGFDSTADQNSLRLERQNEDEIIFSNISKIEDLSKIIVIEGDRLDVKSYQRKSVSILGAINRPGEYVISKGETLASLIKKAEGYREDAYPFGGILNNEKTLEINKKAVDKLYTSFIQKLITKSDALFASESLPFILDELKKANVSGRIMAEFDIDVIKAYPELDTTLNDGDEIIIPIKTQQVFIFGETNNPGTMRYIPGQSLKNYISQSGGLLDTADNNNIFIVHPNGEVNRLENNRLSFVEDRSNILIYPGSVIYVPRKVNSRDAAAVASIWAPIVSAMATSITALSVLDNN